MQAKIYVGNLSYQAAEEDLKNLFAPFGTVQSIDIIRDRYTGQSKGFAFVEMASSQEVQKALSLNGSDFLGRNINVSEARPQEPRGERKGGGGGYSGGPRRGNFGGGGGGGSNRGRGGRDW